MKAVDEKVCANPKKIMSLIKLTKKSDWSKTKISKMKMIVVYQASFFFDSLK